MTTSEFLELLRRSRLLSDVAWKEVEQQLGGEPTVAAASLATWCVRRGLLTKFQAQQLLAGRSGPFRYDGYVIQTVAETDAGWFSARHPEQGSVLLRPIPRGWTEEQVQVCMQECSAQNVRMAHAEGRRFLIADERTEPIPAPPPGVAPAPSVLSRHKREKMPSRSRWWVVGTVLSILVGGGAFTVWLIQTRSRPAPPPKVVSSSDEGQLTPVPPRSMGSLEASTVPRNEQLWARPEPGGPLQLPPLPAGVQTVVYVRPAALERHPEGRNATRSLGPDLAAHIESFWQQTGATADTVETLVIALVPQGTTLPQWVAVAEGGAEISARQGDGFRIWPSNQSPGRWFAGTPSLVEELKTQDGTDDRPAMRREMRDLLPATHANDHILVLTNVNFLRDEAQGLFKSGRQRLLAVLDQFWGTEAQAALLGIQLGRDVMSVELRAVAREDWTPQQLRAHLRREVLAWPTRMTHFLGGIQLDPHWQPLALRFPDMLRFMGEQLRSQCEGRQAAVSIALPVEALHNLLLAGEFALASPERLDPEVPQVDYSQWTLTDLLDAHTSIRIAQKSLEFAAQDIERQVRDDFSGLPFPFRIEIVGTDLQPEGITRNQQIRDFAFVDQSLRSILTELVKAGNPVQNVAEASDPEQKLVWVPSPEADGKVLITTRTAATRKGYELPQAFRE